MIGSRIFMYNFKKKRFSPDYPDSFKYLIVSHYSNEWKVFLEEVYVDAFTYTYFNNENLIMR